MGNHYIPQYYLRGFCLKSDGKIWVYDKKDYRKFCTSVASVANICNLYPGELEKHLAEKVESPANNVLDKIRNRKTLNKEDKDVLSIYIAVMLKRVPTGMERMMRRAPKVFADLKENFHRAVDEQLEKKCPAPEAATHKKAVIDKVFEEEAKDLTPIWHKTIPDESTPKISLAISKMTWTFFTCDEYPVFLTSDNPVCYPQRLGLGNPDCELSFPISNSVSLFAMWKKGLGEGYFPVRPGFVKTMNKRLAYITTRFAFHGKDENWILPFLTKKR